MAAVAGGLAWMLTRGLPEPEAGFARLLREAVVVVIPAAVGAAIYGAGLLMLRVQEMQTIQARVMSRLGRFGR